MLGLWFVGRIFEFIAGHKNIFLLYLIAGISGCICSFALLPYLSVGASASLFGILFCLYIIQKYEEKLSKKFKFKRTNVQLGQIIIINIVINITFGLFTSIFDWAAHLGGSIAGILYGFALTTRHNWNLKIILSQDQKLAVKKNFFENFQVYFFGILIINILFLMSYFKVQKYQKLFGLAIERAALNKTTFLSNHDLSQYEDILVKQNNETNPENILNGALFLHSNGYFLSAEKIYETLILMFNQDFASEKFNSETQKEFILNSLNLAKMKAPLSPNTILTIQSPRDITSLEEICSKPAKLFMTLGYFQFSGKLFACSYSLNLRNDEYAIASMESFHLADDNNGMKQVLSMIINEEKNKTKNHKK
ncbi:rhomboid family intramembrane serine protease [Silvanigrella aquatica]|nr:rhomboid family intramembrane serine protease [Silvanigrella aquatica]